MAKSLSENAISTIQIARDDAISKGAIAAALAIDMLVERMQIKDKVYIVNPEGKDIPNSFFQDFLDAAAGDAQ